MLKRVAILLAFGSLLMGSGAIAHASTATDQFLSDAQAIGFYNDGGNQALVNVGVMVCNDILNGTSPSEEAHMFWEVSKMPSEDAAKAFVAVAIADLCPQVVKSEVT